MVIRNDAGLNEKQNNVYIKININVVREVVAAEKLVCIGLT